MIANASAFPMNTARNAPSSFRTPIPPRLDPHRRQQMLCAILSVSPVDLEVPSRLLGISYIEADATMIEQRAKDCFARVMTNQSRIDPETLRWMMQVIADARSAMLRSAATSNHSHHAHVSLRPQWPTQPAIPARPHDTAPPFAPALDLNLDFPTVVRRRRSASGDIENIATAIGVLVVCGLLIFGVGCFIQQWFDEMPKKRNGVATTNAFPSEPQRPNVAAGSGSPTRPAPVATPANITRAKRRVGPVSPRETTAARDILSQALTLAQQGSFDEAHAVAARAAAGMPDEANALQLMVEYARQYSDLADKARLALNGSDEIDLGTRHGKGQFVEQDAERIVFFKNGAHEPLSIKEFNGLPGVRFRVTRDFLERRQDLPANSLILGSYQYLLQLDRDGLEDHAASRSEAETRFGSAADAEDPAVADHARLMLALLKANLRK